MQSRQKALQDLQQMQSVHVSLLFLIMLAGFVIFENVVMDKGFNDNHQQGIIFDAVPDRIM